MRQAHPLRDAGCDPDRPIGSRRDDPVDLPRPRKPVDALLVLRGEDGALIGERQTDREWIPIDRDDVQVGPRPRGFEQAELGRAGAED